MNKIFWFISKCTDGKISVYEAAQWNSAYNPVDFNYVVFPDKYIYLSTWSSRLGVEPLIKLNWVSKMMPTLEEMQ